MKNCLRRIRKEEKVDSFPIKRRTSESRFTSLQVVQLGCRNDSLRHITLGLLVQCQCSRRREVSPSVLPLTVQRQRKVSPNILKTTLGLTKIKSILLRYWSPLHLNAIHTPPTYKQLQPLSILDEWDGTVDYGVGRSRFVGDQGVHLTWTTQSSSPVSQPSTVSHDTSEQSIKTEDDNDGHKSNQEVECLPVSQTI